MKSHTDGSSRPQLGMRRALTEKFALRSMNRRRIELAARYGLPAICAERNFAAEGGLVSYGADYVDHFRQAAVYVDRILRGEKPADPPVQQPSKFDLVINLKTAKALSITVSNSLAIARRPDDRVAVAACPPVAHSRRTDWRWEGPLLGVNRTKSPYTRIDEIDPPGDPIGAGLVTSLAYPGGNITGTSLMMPDIGGKRLQLLREIVPTLRRVAVLGNTKNASTAAELRATEAAAKSLGLQVHAVGVESPDRLDDGLSEIVRDRPDGLLVLLDTLTARYRGQIAEFALQNRLVSVFPGRIYVESGGLVGFGPDLSAVARRAAVYVDKILKGAKPADLPVEQPTKFELLINLKTAKALGLAIPDTLLARADEVIE